MSIIINHRGNFKNIDRFFRNASDISRKYLRIFEKYGAEGVQILSDNTPKDTGKTASSWYYEIVRTRSGVTLRWLNSNVDSGVPIAILIQYGHATQSGGFVEGIDFINPSLKPIFDKLSQDIWREVTR
jgi:hypothetical protein